MQQTLNGKSVAILIADGFEEVQLTEPKLALDEAGALTVIVSPEQGCMVRGWKGARPGDEFAVDQMITNADATEYDALLLPGGMVNPDRLSLDRLAIGFVRRFFDLGKPVAAIGHGPWLLMQADVLHGRTLTSQPSLAADIRQAGGHWVDRDVVRDGNLITSRGPDDLPPFIPAMLSGFAEAAAALRRAATAAR